MRESDLKKTLQRLIRLLYVDSAPRAPSSSACLFSINLRADRQEHENIRGGIQGAANASVLLDQDPSSSSTLASALPPAPAPAAGGVSPLPMANGGCGCGSLGWVTPAAAGFACKGVFD
jgi:hypothetical protein